MNPGVNRRVAIFAPTGTGRNLQDKNASRPGPASERNIATHHPGVIAADCQAQSGAAPCSAKAGLGKQLKQAGLLFFANSRPVVPDFHPQPNIAMPRLAGTAAEKHRHLPLLGEFNRVVYQIDQYLAELLSVCNYRIGSLRLLSDDQFQSLALCLGQEHRPHVAQQLLQAKIRLLQAEPA